VSCLNNWSLRIFRPTCLTCPLRWTTLGISITLLLPPSPKKLFWVSLHVKVQISSHVWLQETTWDYKIQIIALRLALHNLCRGYSILCNVRKEERNYRTEETGYVTSEINLLHNNEVLWEAGCTGGCRADMWTEETTCHSSCHTCEMTRHVSLVKSNMWREETKCYSS